MNWELIVSLKKALVYKISKLEIFNTYNFSNLTNTELILG